VLAVSYGDISGQSVEINQLIPPSTITVGAVGVTYQLRALIRYLGKVNNSGEARKGTGGHFVAYLRDDDGKWIFFDDLVGRTEPADERINREGLIGKAELALYQQTGQ